MPRCRALISVPIEADDDEGASAIADEHAASLCAKLLSGAEVILGHTELITEVHGMTPVRVVHEDHGFRRQIPDRGPVPSL